MLRRVLRALRPPPPAPPPRPRRTLRDYPRTDAELWAWPDALFDPAFLAAARDGSDAALDAVVTEVHPGVFALRPLTDDACRRLVAEARRVEAWCAANRVEPDRPNTMNRYGLVLADVGLDLAPLRRALDPFFRRRFAAVGGAGVDHDHAFLVDYARGKDVDLGFHVDDAEITLNLCLGERFEGGELYFQGVRCLVHRDDAPRDDEPFEWTHRPGVALLHAGAHRHGVYPLRRGARTNLVLWARSTAVRAAAPDDGTSCPPWCGAR